MLDATSPAAVIGDLGQPAMPTMDGLLNDFVRTNPNLAWLAQLLAARRQAAQQEPDIDPRHAELQALQEELAQRAAREARLERAVRRLSADLEAAHAFLADLAAAFGACGSCWGEDTNCRSCRGRGRPGRFAPDPELRMRFFAAPVEPAVASRTSTQPDHS